MSVNMKSIVLSLAWGASLVFSQCLLAGPEEQFATPEEAVQALKTAIEPRDSAALEKIFGPELHNLISVDEVQASNRFALFAKRISEKSSLTKQSDDQMVLEIGNDRWPFPIPLVRHDGQWSFDTEAGKEEILNRRIGWDELQTIRVCKTYVQAQREYAAEDRCGDGVLEYAQFLRSSPGKHDGLYWHATGDEEPSPFGPLVAQAHVEGYRKETRIMTDAQKPYHGYFYKILTRQGRHAPGGKYNYIINGRLIAGYALVAWPAEWGNTGIMTFIVNQQGKVYQKCLGAKTARSAAKMTTFDPDSSWTLVP